MNFGTGYFALIGLMLRRSVQLKNYYLTFNESIYQSVLIRVICEKNNYVKT